MEIKSDKKHIGASREAVYKKLADLRHLEPLTAKIKDEHVSDIRITEDSVSLNVSPVGEVRLNITERDENERLRFAAAGAPVQAYMDVKLEEKNGETELGVTLSADVPMMLKMMVEGPAKKFVGKLADALAAVDYNA